MDLFILTVTCAIDLVLGLFVLLRDSRKVYARLFVAITIILTVWIVSNYLTNHHVDNLTVANFANKLAFVSGFGVVLSALLFTYNFPSKRDVSSMERFVVAMVSTIILAISMTDWVAGVVTLNSSNMLEFSIGPLLWLYIIGFGSTIVMMARNLLGSWKKQSEVKRRQSRLIFIGFAGSALFGLVLNVIIPVIAGNWDSTRYGPLVTVLLVGTIAYAIVKHGLFDIRLAAVRGVAYVFSLATLGGLYYLVALGISEFFMQGQQSDAISQSPASIALALVLAFIFQPVKKFFDRLTNSIFFHDNYDTDDFLERLGHELSTASELRDLLQRASNEIGGTIQAEQAFFFVRYGDGQAHQLNAGTARHGALASSEVPVMDAYVGTAGSGAIVVDLLPETEPIYRLLRRHKIAIVLPLTHDGAVLSYLLIGRRRSREYTRRDVRVLETIANELVIAIQNALSVQEVKDINATLQQRVNDATKELRASNKQLQRLDAAKDEFVSMASHQLRTPLTSVKGYISMVLEGDAGHISATQRQLLEEAFTSSERMVHLIGDFLNVSRLQTGKFMIDTHPTDLVKLVKQEVASLKTTADAHDLKLRFRAPAYFPVLYVDEGKLRQVVMNFIDNAIYYSREDTTISVELSVVDGSAVLQVRDTGIGVPKLEQAHLFTKFFRASNARKQRPDGTGVGLFLAKKVVVAHGGSVLFESTEGKGSVFGFRLPIKKLSSAPTESTEEFKE